VRQLVAQVLLDALAPKGVDEEILGAADGARLGHEERPALRQLGIARLHEALIAGVVLEKVDLNDRVARRQLQFLINLVAHSGQFLEQRLVVRHLEIGHEDIRRDAERKLGRVGSRVVRLGLGFV